MLAVGIDLGTTHSALALADLNERAPTLRLLAIPQLIGPGEVAVRPTLPSFLYLAGEHDLPAGATALPWRPEDPTRRTLVGELARSQGALVPGRLIASAKSWLCHPAVDRSAPILPWAAPVEVERCSPIDASAAYLAHLAAAFQAESGERLASAELVLTVPASFDEVARELTVEAARRAGLERLTLLEEPQAAFYSWLADHGAKTPGVLSGGETVLVCDIGGGTTDFTLISVAKGAAGLEFHRTAVGDHLLLGGDNMDLALARRVERRLSPAAPLDGAHFQTLLQSCRTAKEQLLGPRPRSSWTIHLAGRGRGLVGGSASTELERAEVEALLLDGFFPRVGFDAAPAANRTLGLREFGLPYVQDPSITAHLASFLRRHQARPEAVLWNGGVMTSHSVRERLLDMLTEWTGRRPQVLENDLPDLAVARGAAYYARVRRGEGIRIGAGAARSYYIEVDAPEPTVLCLSARGETESHPLDREFELLTNRPVRFHLSSASDRRDPVGALLPLPKEGLSQLPPIVTVLRFPHSSQDRLVKVRLEVQHTELGTLDLHLVAPEHRWKLAFDLRTKTAPDPEPPRELDPGQLQAATDVLRGVFDPVAPKPIPPEQAMKRLGQALSTDKADWPTELLRQLWESLKELRGHRGRTEEHEARWLNWVGYCLRPGYGCALDDWRVKEAWRLFNSGLIHDRERPRLEWWILWRRIAGGLTRAMQDEIGKRVFPHLLGDKKKTADKRSPSPQELGEMWRTVGSLEHTPAGDKTRLGEVLLDRVARGRANEAEIWALGRLGARVPLYGSTDNVVPRSKAEKWIARLLDAPWESKELLFAAATLARASGDRARDLDLPLRKRVAARLLPSAAPHLERLVLEPAALEPREERAAFGEALPVGLRLSSQAGRAQD